MCTAAAAAAAATRDDRRTRSTHVYNIMCIILCVPGARAVVPAAEQWPTDCAWYRTAAGAPDVAAAAARKI